MEVGRQEHLSDSSEGVHKQRPPADVLKHFILLVHVKNILDLIGQLSRRLV